MEIGDVVKDKLSNAKYNKHKIINMDLHQGKTVYELKDITYIAIPTVWRFEEDIEIIEEH